MIGLDRNTQPIRSIASATARHLASTPLGFRGAVRSGAACLWRQRSGSPRHYVPVRLVRRSSAGSGMGQCAALGRDLEELAPAFADGAWRRTCAARPLPWPAVGRGAISDRAVPGRLSGSVYDSLRLDLGPGSGVRVPLSSASAGVASTPSVLLSLRVGVQYRFCARPLDGLGIGGPHLVRVASCGFRVFRFSCFA